MNKGYVVSFWLFCFVKLSCFYCVMDVGPTLRIVCRLISSIYLVLLQISNQEFADEIFPVTRRQACRHCEGGWRFAWYDV